MQAHLDATGNGDVGEAIVIGGGPGPVRLSYKRLHVRSLVSLVGEVSVSRIGYAAPGHASVRPLDDEFLAVLPAVTSILRLLLFEAILASLLLAWRGGYQRESLCRTRRCP